MAKTPKQKSKRVKDSDNPLSLKKKTKKLTQKPEKSSAKKTTTKASSSKATKTKSSKVTTKTKSTKATKTKSTKSSKVTKKAAIKKTATKISTSKALSPRVLSTEVQPLQGALSSYIHHISKWPLLTKAEEYKLTVQYHETKDPEVAKILIQSNLRFVIKVASEYSKFNVKIMDLIQEGNIGLVKAVQEFNPYKGAKLITYAVWWIRGYIQDYLMKNYSIVRLGKNKRQQKLFYILKKEQQALEEFGQKKLLPMITSSSNSTEQETEYMQEIITKKDLSFDQPLTKDSSSTFLDFHMDSSMSVEEELDQHQQKALLKKTLKEMEKDLSEKEKSIIKNRLLKDPPDTLQKIADTFSVTREAIRQAEERLLKKWRVKLAPLLKKDI